MSAKAKSAKSTPAVNVSALKSAVASGKLTSRKLRAQFGKLFTAANKAGNIAWKRISRKGMKAFYVATAA